MGNKIIERKIKTARKARVGFTTGFDIFNAPEIKVAMDNLGLGEKTEDLLDEIELQNHLKISLEQADKGITMSLEDAEKEMSEWMKNVLKI